MTVLITKKKPFVFLLFYVFITCIFFGHEKIEFLAIPVHYDIKANLLPSEHAISVYADVTLKAEEDSFSEIILGYDKHFKMLSVFDENKNSLKFEEEEKGGYKYISVSLPFGKSLRKGNKFSLRFHYSGRVNTFVSDVNIISEELTELGQAAIWYPRELNYISEFTYSLDITAPGDQTIVTSSQLAPLDRVEIVGDKKRWIFRRGTQRSWTIFFCASNRLKMYSRKEGIIFGRIYYVNANEEQIKVLFENIISIFETYNEFYGSYSDEESFAYFLAPRKGWSYVRGEMVVMPENGLVSSIKAGILPKNQYKYLAHELGHLWWGKGVRFKAEDEHPNSDWLTEGFAEYSSLLALEKKFGREAVKDYLESFRESIINTPKDIPITKAIKDKCKDWFNWRDLTYYKSAYVLYMLRYVMGDEKFFTMMNTFFNENLGKNITTYDYFRYIEKFGGDLFWFVDEWFLNTGVPQYKLTYSISKESKDRVIINGEIIQMAKIFKMPLEIDFCGGDNKIKIIRVMVEREKTPFYVVLDFLPEKIDLDPRRKVLKRN